MTSRIPTAAGALLLAVVLTACGSDPGADPGPETLPSRVEVVFDRQDTGVSATFEPTEVRCRTGTLVVTGDSPLEAYLTLRVAAVDEPTTYTIPADPAGRKALRPQAYLAYDSEALTASSARPLPADAAGGTIEVLEASCDPVVLRVRFDARIGVAYSKRPAAVTGSIDLAR